MRHSMVTRIWSRGEKTLAVGGRQFQRGPRVRTGDDPDPLLREQLLSALPHAPGDDHVGTLFMEPTRQNARLMRGWR